MIPCPVYGVCPVGGILVKFQFVGLMFEVRLCCPCPGAGCRACEAGWGTAEVDFI